jgi:alanine-glyoxylate transaminase/serine-glyoxylate transaminase/serine-pyruvate transaminase
MQMSALDTGLLVIDVQEKLLPRIHNAGPLLRNLTFLLEAARLLEMTVQATEQYPKGLGPTVTELLASLPERPDKVAFSSCAVPSIVSTFQREARPKVVVAGIETHVCVLHTVLDLLALDFRVFVPVDAVGSRYHLDHDIALRRMEQAGAVLTTAETCVFEWIGGAGHPRFKDVSTSADRLASSGPGFTRESAMTLPGQLNPTPRLLLGPGPCDVHPRVLRAMSTPLIGHMDPQFLEFMTATQDMMRQTFQTKNPLTFPVSATGMAGMETCLVNLLEPGDKMVDLDAVREVLQRVRPKALGIVHAETSTGAWQPIEELGKLCHEFDTLLIVDAVTALGCIPLAVDDWGVDAAYSCSQKGLGCPPGLSPVTFSPRAVEAIQKRKTKVQSWYLDLSLVQKYWESDRFYHHTGPITMIYALYEGLRVVLEEGLQARWDRHRRNHLALKAGLTALGLPYTAAAGHQLPQLNAVRLPAGVDDLTVRKRLLADFGIEIGGGLGDFKGKVWRIGLMGYNSRPANVYLVLAALEQCLQGQAGVTPGAGVAAAERAYAV